MNTIQAIKEQARRFARYPYGNGGYLDSFALAEAAGHVVPWADHPEGHKSKSADQETFRLAGIANAAAKKLQRRHARFVRYMKETRHAWKLDDASVTHWADNSITGQEVSQMTGERRQTWIDTPHGDRCF